jgi:hypothetical protein
MHFMYPDPFAAQGPLFPQTQQGVQVVFKPADDVTSFPVLAHLRQDSLCPVRNTGHHL